MKKTIILSAIAVCLSIFKANAQTVNGVRLSEIRADYIEISEFKPLLSDKILISLEYGQKVFDVRKNALIKDDDDVNLEFNSLVDCLNKLKNYGYELFEAYSLKQEDKDAVKIYILKKR